MLPSLLARRTSLEVLSARDGLELAPGRVIVAVPDRHLMVVAERGREQVLLGGGARENGHRPAHDAMMRSAALLRGPRTVGIVLTGLLDDGAAGMRAISRYGGCCLVQDPSEAAFPDMPRAALRAVPEATPLPLDRLAEEVVAVVERPPSDPPAVSQQQRERDLAELASALGEDPHLPDGSIPGEPSSLACPSCHGVLHFVPDSVLRYRCRTGHAWTAESLIVEQDGAVEEAIWAALRALEERADLAERLATRASVAGRNWSTAHYAERRDEARRASATLRALLGQTMSRSLPEDHGA